MTTYVNENTLVDSIHALPTKAAIIVTGGGTQIFPTLLHRGGGSSTLYSGLIPYSQEEVLHLLYKDNFDGEIVSEEAVNALAMVAYRRIREVLPESQPVVGIASSSILQRTPVERENRRHVIYAALRTTGTAVSVKLEIDKKLIDSEDPVVIRMLEEDINSHMILNLLAEGSECSYRVWHRGIENIVRQEK